MELSRCSCFIVLVFVVLCVYVVGDLLYEDCKFLVSGGLVFVGVV